MLSYTMGKKIQEKTQIREISVVYSFRHAGQIKVECLTVFCGPYEQDNKLANVQKRRHQNEPLMLPVHSKLVQNLECH